MSLINETLRDLDRRKDEEGWGQPVPPRPSPRRAVVIPRFVLILLAGCAVAGWLAARDGDAARFAERFALTPRAVLPEAVQQRIAAASPQRTPDVAAPPPAVSPSDPADALESAIAHRSELRTLFVDGGPSRVRVDLEVTGPLGSEPRPVLIDGELYLTLGGVKIASSLDPTTAGRVDTPWLKGLDLVEEAEGVVVRLAFEGEVDFRSQLVRRAAGSHIALELHAAPPKRAKPAPRRPRVAALPEIPSPTSVRAPAPPAQAAPEVVDTPDVRMERTEREATPAERATANVREANALLEAGATSEALTLLQSALREAPGHEGASLALAQAWLHEGRRTEAAELLTRLHARNPTSASVAKLLAGLRADEGRSAEALAVLARIAPVPFDDVALHALRASLLQDLERHEAAVTSFRNVLQLSPHRADAWLGMGISLEALGQREPAHTAYRAALRVGGLGERPARWAEARVEALAR